MKKLLFVLAATAMLFVAAPASAQYTFLYGGLHPINPSAGGGFCYDNQAHSHHYPVDANVNYLYRNLGGYQYFVGDPYRFGYQGQAFPYYGHHPLPSMYGASYCYLDASHYHHFLPPTGHAAYYVVNNGYYYYQGGLPAWYYTYRPNYYRRYHTYWHLPGYRRYYGGYRRFWRTYARRANIRYFRHRPRMVYRYRRPPVRSRAWARTNRAWRRTRPVYRYRPRSYRTSYYGSRYRARTYQRPSWRSTTRAYRPTRVYRPRVRTYRPSRSGYRSRPARTYRSRGRRR